uniref:Kinesin-like protein n=1 Tax=Fagus sylvatica TaxID=28930 RepID=A0A2N9J3Z5_FAGSY
MASENQNKRPFPNNNNSPTTRATTTCSSAKKCIGDEKMVGTANNGRFRQAFSVVNGGQDLCPNSAPASNAGSECGGIEFTREDVEALLNEKPKRKDRFNLKERCDNMVEYIKRLKLCVKWFQELEGSYLFEQEKLRNTLDSAEQKCNEIEVLMKNKEEELNSIIMELRKNYASSQEKFTKEESDKLAAMDSLAREKEARLNMERSQTSLSEELARAQRDLLSANQKIASLNDMYKRLQEYNTSLQQYNGKLHTDLSTVEDELKRVEKDKSTMVESLSMLRGQLTMSRASQDEAIKQKDALVNEAAFLRAEVHQVRDDRDRLQSQAQALTTDLVKYKESAEKYGAELDILTIRSSELEATCSSQNNQLKILQNRLAIAEDKLQLSDSSAMETRTEYEGQKKLINELQSRLADAEFKLVEGEMLRKKLHNTILELKGNIRVFCRVRPLLPDDGISTEGKVISYPTSTEALGRGIDMVQNGQKHAFTFDQVFLPDATQDDVFVEISQLVQSALDGYKVCIFAYGQTGSGKTYTMMGRPGHPEQKGLIPRSLEQIFQTRQALQPQGWRYEMQVSMLEIYNETIRDLLSTNRSSSTENGVAGKQYTIKHDGNGNTHVSDLTILDVRSAKEVSFLLDQAAQSRSVGKTQMNEQSSRSHFVFTLRIFGVNESTEQQVQGVLNLIDLAGSERLSKSGSTGDRLKETQPCLGGDSKTLMFVNISPDPSSVGESLCSLRFAARVNACEIGIPRRQTSMRPSDSRLSYG